MSSIRTTRDANDFSGEQNDGNPTARVRITDVLLLSNPILCIIILCQDTHHILEFDVTKKVNFNNAVVFVGSPTDFGTV